MAFSDLEHPDLEPFEPTFRRIVEIAFSPPLLFPESAILAARWAPTDRRRRFIAEILAAYGEVQRAVAPEVLSIEREARAFTAQLRAARQAKDNSAAKLLGRKIEVSRRRQLVLRRILDAIVHVVSDQYVVFIRRLALHDHVRPVDPDTASHMVESAAQLNMRDPYTLYLAADLTTSVQIGDLIEVSTDELLRWRVRIVEVKEGKVNRILSEHLAAGNSLGNLRDTLGEKAVRQAERMVRQERRLKGLADFTQTGKGLDPRTDQVIRRTQDRPPTPGYHPELRSLIEKAVKTGQHLIVIDDCLTLAAVRRDIIPEPRLVEATHALFHRDHPETPCLLDTAKAQEELDLLIKEPAIDLLENNYRAAWERPFSHGAPWIGCATLLRGE